jgi:hypothetical protein
MGKDEGKTGIAAKIISEVAMPCGLAWNGARIDCNVSAFCVKIGDSFSGWKTSGDLVKVTEYLTSESGLMKWRTT